MKVSSLPLAASAIAIATLMSTVDAMPGFVSRIPNGANVDGVSALGHEDPSGGGALNAFGEAFDAAGRKWTTALCQADSDGDGQTNGQELGDPCCVWTSGGVPKFSSGVSHPGDASKTVDASVLAGNTCPATDPSSGTATAPPTATSTSTPSTTSPASPTTASSSAAPISTSVAIAVMAGVAAMA